MSITVCVSEEGAKKKWCPASMSLPETDTRYGGPANCAGSDCMAWRWIETNIGDGKGGLKPSTDTHGYCGLAGQPWSRT